MAEAIQVTGLRELNKALKAMDTNLPKKTRVALNESADLVISGARPPVPRRSGRASNSLRAASTRTAVRVTAGGTRAKYYPWLDFGGKVGRGRSVSRPWKKEGRYLYPAYRKLKQSGQFQERMRLAIVSLATEAGLKVD